MARVLSGAFVAPALMPAPNENADLKGIIDLRKRRNKNTLPQPFDCAGKAFRGQQTTSSVTGASRPQRRPLGDITNQRNKSILPDDDRALAKQAATKRQVWRTQFAAYVRARSRLVAMRRSLDPIQS